MYTSQDRIKDALSMLVPNSRLTIESIIEYMPDRQAAILVAWYLIGMHSVECYRHAGLLAGDIDDVARAIGEGLAIGQADHK